MLELKNIIKSYGSWEQKVTVLNWINLKVSEWEFVAIMWPSWSWKSTLMNIIWLLDNSDSGEYFIENQKIDNLDESNLSTIRRKNIWFIFQNYSLIPRMNVLEQVKLPLIYQWVKNSEAEKRSKDSLKKVGLEWKEKNLPNELSWWQKQRIAIARALVISPKIMLADEPTWALDSKTSDEIMNLLEELNREWKTIILITHEKEVADRADRIIMVKDWNVMNI